MLPRLTLLRALILVFLTGAAGGIWLSYTHTITIWSNAPGALIPT